MHCYGGNTEVGIYHNDEAGLLKQFRSSDGKFRRCMRLLSPPLESSRYPRFRFGDILKSVPSVAYVWREISVGGLPRAAWRLVFDICYHHSTRVTIFNYYLLLGTERYFIDDKYIHIFS